MGGGNAVPLTYVDNCAEAIVLAGIRAKVEGETCKVVVDDLPTGREFLRLYQRNVHRVASTGLERCFEGCRSKLAVSIPGSH